MPQDHNGHDHQGHADNPPGDRGRPQDLDIRAAWLHRLADALLPAGVIAGTLAIAATGWSWIDPALGLVIAAVILHGSWGRRGRRWTSRRMPSRRAPSRRR